METPYQIVEATVCGHHLLPFLESTRVRKALAGSLLGALAGSCNVKYRRVLTSQYFKMMYKCTRRAAKIALVLRGRFLTCARCLRDAAQGPNLTQLERGLDLMAAVRVHLDHVRRKYHR